MAKTRVRPFAVDYEGTERLIIAPSKRAVQKHLLQPLIKKHQPALEKIRLPSPVEIGAMIGRGVVTEIYVEQPESDEEEQGSLGITDIREAEQGDV